MAENKRVGKLKIKLLILFLLTSSFLWCQDLESFINSGFGFSYEFIDHSNYETFIEKNGEPLKILVKDSISRHTGILNKIYTLVYETITVKYLVYSETNTGQFPKSNLLNISATESYQYQSKIFLGMLQSLFYSCFNIDEDYADYLLLTSEDYHYVSIIFEDDKLNSIIWNYTLE